MDFSHLAEGEARSNSVMKCHVAVVSITQILASLQVWFIPCMIASLYFRGVPNFYIVIACLLIIPIIFNLIVASHYWYRGLLIAGLMANAIAGLGALGTVIAVWTMARDSNITYSSPNIGEAGVMMLITAALMTFTAVTQVILLASTKGADSTYSCCWGNTSAPIVGNVRAPTRFIHIIRTMRVMGFIVLLANLVQLWSFAFWRYPYTSGRLSYTTSQTTLILNLRIMSLFYFTMTALWSIIAIVLSFNINSSRKLRFMSMHTIFALLLSSFFVVVHFSSGVRTFKLKGAGPSPWVMLAIIPFEFIWLVCAMTLAYSKYPFRTNSCCWPDCTSSSALEEEFDIWIEHPDETDGL